MNTPEFVVGGKYENRAGPYTVISVKGDEMVVRTGSGNVDVLSVSYQRKILENIAMEKGRAIQDLQMEVKAMPKILDSEKKVSAVRPPVMQSTNGKTSISDRLKANITEIEKRTDLTDDEKVRRITHIACATCAGIAIQPIPFADIFILTPVQAYFGARIGAIRGVPISDSSAEDLIKELVGVVGMGVIAQQLALGVWKLITFGAGGLVTIPLVYALTFAVMRVIDAYMSAKSRRQTLSNDQLKAVWKSALKDGKQRGKEKEDEIKKG